jgi:Ca2+-binding EF-hand superfamily protein
MTPSLPIAGLAALLLTTAAAAAAPAAAVPAAPTVRYADIKTAADKAWDRLDANHDGRIDHADHDARLLERFARWDTNHDGVIGKDEFLALMHAREDGMRRMAMRWHHPADTDGAAPPPSPPPPPHDGEGWHGGHPGGRVAMVIISDAMRDARHDGVITRAAYDAAVKAAFDRIDTDHDGMLTRAELRAAWRDGARGHGWHRREGAHGPWARDAMPPPPPSPKPQ